MPDDGMDTLARAAAPSVLRAEPFEAATRVLVVDDDGGIADVVRRRLELEGLQCRTVGSAEEAVPLLEPGAFHLLVTDIRMPGMSGLELLRRAKSVDPLIKVVVMTAFADTAHVIEALRGDADDYLLKPFDIEALVESARRVLEHRLLVLESRAYRRGLEERVREQARRLEALYLAGIHALVAALEAKDANTRGHSERVSRYAVALGRALGASDTEMLAVGARLHDIGKIGTRDDVLRKPGPLDTSEYGHIRQHPVIGVQILSPILGEETVLAVVRHHHERWDGGGYPDGLAGDRIPWAARIVAVADALDAMTSARAYRPARDWADALTELRAGSGTQFDPRVIEAALDTLRERPAAAAREEAPAGAS